MQILNLHFLQILLFLGLVSLVFFYFFIFYNRKKELYKSFPGISEGKYFFLKYVFLLFAFCLIFFSVFLGNTTKTDFQKGGELDVLFVLDVSSSMNVADVIEAKNDYTRLDFSKKIIGDFVSQNRGANFGLVIFSGEAFSSIPLTYDTNAFLKILKMVNARNLTKQGSDIISAIQFANTKFSSKDDRKKIMIIFSDGAEKNNDFASIFDNTISYFVVGIGSKKGGKIITDTNESGELIYKTHEGKYVVKKLQESNLQALASALSAPYFSLKNGGSIAKISDALEKLEKKSIISNNLNLSKGLGFGSFLCFMVFFILVAFSKNNKKLGKK